jgi:hypothetical protein
MGVLLQQSCHTDWQQSWIHRYIAVAVSQTNRAGVEDLSKPFHKYVLFDEVGDRPEMTVSDNYLILDHMIPASSVAVFDANALAGG